MAIDQCIHKVFFIKWVLPRDYTLFSVKMFTENNSIRKVFMVTKRLDQRNDPLTRFW